MDKEIKLKSIGVINTPYKEPKGIPIQGKFEKGVTAQAEIFPKYREGLKDIEGFSHIILIYHFHLTVYVKNNNMPRYAQLVMGPAGSGKV